MKRLLGPLMALVLLAQGCLGGGSNERIVRVDYSSDRYASFFLYNFPKKIAVHPGTTLIFRQTWTGEPHTVTGGTFVSKTLVKTRALLDIFVSFDALRASGAPFPDPEKDRTSRFRDFVSALKKAMPVAKRKQFIDAYRALQRSGMKLGDLGNPPDVTFHEATKAIDEAANTAFDKLPFAFAEEGNTISQNVGQPCFRTTGGPPKDAKTPCPKSQQRQTPFDGTQSFYNSGIIRYRGATGNTYRIPLAKDIKPGKYTFYCAVHGPLQSTEVDVRPNSAKVPSQEEISRETSREILAVAKPLNQVWADARDGRITLNYGGEHSTLEGPFAGLGSAEEEHAAINAFVPRRFTVKAGEPIHWKIMGAGHTISFNVPTYFPPVEFLKDGTVRLNPKLDKAYGGAPPPPQGEDHPAKVDGGTYDGTGFWSTGLTSPCPECGSTPYIEYTLRISKPGKYKYACLLHPPMVGTVVVTP